MSVYSQAYVAELFDRIQGIVGIGLLIAQFNIDVELRVVKTRSSRICHRTISLRVFQRAALFSGAGAWRYFESALLLATFVTRLKRKAMQGLEISTRI